MVSQYDKLWIALILALIQLLNGVFHYHIGLSEEAVTTLVVLLAPTLTYLIPNKQSGTVAITQPPDSPNKV